MKKRKSYLTLYNLAVIGYTAKFNLKNLCILPQSVCIRFAWFSVQKAYSTNRLVLLMIPQRVSCEVETNS